MIELQMLHSILLNQCHSYLYQLFSMLWELQQPVQLPLFSDQHRQQHMKLILQSVLNSALLPFHPTLQARMQLHQKFEFPAVTVPFSANTGFSFANASKVVSALGPSSVSIINFLFFLLFPST